EEAMLAAAAPPGPLLAIAPRHPERGQAIADALARSGRVVARRAAGEPISGATEIYVADTLGEMGLWFALADVVVMGGSFVGGGGGHSPMEAAWFAKLVVVGTDRSNFADVYADMLGPDGGAVEAANVDAMSEALKSLLARPDERERRGAAALAYAKARAGE